MNPLTSLILAAAFYIVLLPILFWALGFGDKKLKNRRFQKKLMKPGANKNQLYREQPTPVWPKWKERLKFTRADKRQFVLAGGKKKEPKVFPVTRRTFYWGLRGAGLVVALIAGIAGSFLLFLVAAGVYIASLVYGYKSADRLMVEREKLYKRMFSVARSKLQQSAEYESNPQAVIRVTEWRDYVKLQKVEFDIPDTFGEEATEAFMKQFNQLFGRETAWVPADNEETGDPGWDFEKGVVTISAVPPLPRQAPWMEHYVLAKEVAWSFFPIGLGVEHGLELPNPETGVVENVLGFDRSGEQGKVADKYGITMAQAITTSPMALIAGGTGGGKALSVDTMIKTLDQEEVDAYRRSQEDKASGA